MPNAIVTAAYHSQNQEWVYPYYRLQEAGFKVDLVKPYNLNKPDIDNFGVPIPFTHNSLEVIDKKYDLIVLSGGAIGAEYCRMDKNILDIVYQHNRNNVPIGAICHGPWVLISANVVRDKTITAFEGMKDDVKNAGAHYLNEPVVTHDNIVTSPHYKYNPDFMRELLKLYENC